MKHIIYKITNGKTNKSYIGYTKAGLKSRWKQHLSRAKRENNNVKFDNALRKHDRGCWNVEVLERGLNKYEAKLKEQHYIEQYGTYLNGYNSTKGGDGNNGIIMTEESNKKRSEALKGKPKLYDRMHGKSHSTETRKKISQAHKGMKKPWVKWSDKQIEKRAKTRRSLTHEQYKKIHEEKNNGKTYREISNEMNISLDLVKKWANLSWELQDR